MPKVLKVYCAGPLFNAVEKREMAQIRAILLKDRDKKREIFLPQRDGLELKSLKPAITKKEGSLERASKIIDRSIFSLDIYYLLHWSNVVVANLNGRVPDEGTVVEAALAWRAGKGLVLYKKDARSPFEGSDNPMLTGLTDFIVEDSIKRLPEAVDHALVADREERIHRTIQLGEKIASVLKRTRSSNEIAQQLISLSEEPGRK